MANKFIYLNPTVNHIRKVHMDIENVHDRREIPFVIFIRILMNFNGIP